MVFLAIACSLHGFREDPISPPFSESFGRPWSPLGPFWIPLAPPQGSPWGHLGPPWTLQTTPWAHLGRPLGPPWDPDQKTLKKGISAGTLWDPFFH